MFFQLTSKLIFPNPALAEEDGLLAMGGDLSVERLVLAYQNSIFLTLQSIIAGIETDKKSLTSSDYLTQSCMPIDITKVFEKYKGQWVAFKDDEKTVVGNGKTAKEAYEKAITNGYNKPILARMPVELVNYIGYSL